MTTANKNIVDTYLNLIEGLDRSTKTKLIDRLSKSLNKEKEPNESAFFECFGAFADGRSAEEIIADIKNSRTFREKDVKI